MMRVYLAVLDPYNSPNPFVRTLVDGMKHYHTDVEFGWGDHTFWTNEVFEYNIVHIQWPHFFCIPPHAHFYEELQDRLNTIKSQGIKIVATCHNLHPHIGGDENERMCYEAVYSFSDLILHMGSYSLNSLSRVYPEARHLLLNHHVYDELYPVLPNRRDAIKALKLNPKYKYILCFGAFRNQEERDLIIELAKKLSHKGYAILAPSFMTVRPKQSLLDFNIDLRRKWYYQFRYHIYVTGSTYKAVNDELLPYYYAASDVALIQRLDILNSGNVPMAFLMQKPVVGPNAGNVGELLKRTNNYLFDRSSIDTIPQLIHKACSSLELGQSNFDYAMSNMSTLKIVNELHGYYLEILSTK